MIEVMPESKEDVLVVSVTQKLSDDDYRQIFVPKLEEIIEKYGKATVLVYLDDGYDGIELGAIWDDVKFGIKHRNDFIKVAAVGAPRWMDWAMKASSAIMSGEVRTVSTERLREAHGWVNT
ncbi:MAG: STAS/SEC14 domain-containing protein [Syntrophobacteraceae bacterium]